jgi:hypothetical protein
MGRRGVNNDDSQSGRNPGLDGRQRAAARAAHHCWCRGWPPGEPPDCSAAYRSPRRRWGTPASRHLARPSHGKASATLTPRAAASAGVRILRHLRRPGRGDGRRLADGERQYSRSGSGHPAPVDGVDLRRRVQAGPGRQPRLRRTAHRPRRRWSRGHLQLPCGYRGVHQHRGRARQPGSARPGGRAGVGTGQHRSVRRRPEHGHRVRRVGGRGIGGGPAGDAERAGPVPPGDRTERCGRPLLGGTGSGHRNRHRGTGGPAPHGRRPVDGGSAQADQGVCGFG